MDKRVTVMALSERLPGPSTILLQEPTSACRHWTKAAPYGKFSARAVIFGIAGRTADFLKIAPGPIFDPQGVENRIPHAKIFRFHQLK